MTLEEFKRKHRQAEETAEKLKAEIPQTYDDVLRLYKNYKIRHTIVKNALAVLYYELENVKGVDLTKERGTYNKDASIEKYYSISDKIAELEHEQGIIQECINGLEYIKDNVKDATLKAKIQACYFNAFIG